jgi:hypothetical protein
MNKKTMTRVSRTFIFLQFLHVSTGDSNALVAAVQPPPEGDSELIHGNASHYPSQAFLMVSGDNRTPASSSFTLLNKKKSAGARSGE